MVPKLELKDTIAELLSQRSQNTLALLFVISRRPISHGFPQTIWSNLQRQRGYLHQARPCSYHHNRSSQLCPRPDHLHPGLPSQHKTWLRLYKPIPPPPDSAKLPLILYIHGGGFIMCGVSESDVHDVCAAMANELPAVILSLEYRLAPESRLPAAYEDTLEALVWVQNQALSENHMLKDVVDFSQVYLMGSSAGGNIAYHAGLGALSLDLKPLLIKGYIFDHPFFSGEERSGSEMRLADDPLLPLAVCDLMWELSLPKGCDRDHEYCNPLVEGSYKDKIGMLRRCFVNMRGGDLLVDYQMEFVKMLEANGVCVVTRFLEEGYHCMDVEEIGGENGKDLLIALKQFISGSSG